MNQYWAYSYTKAPLQLSQTLLGWFSIYFSKHISYFITLFFVLATTMEFYNQASCSSVHRFTNLRLLPREAGAPQTFNWVRIVHTVRKQWPHSRNSCGTWLRDPDEIQNWVSRTISTLYQPSIRATLKASLAHAVRDRSIQCMGRISCSAKSDRCTNSSRWGTLAVQFKTEA